MTALQIQTAMNQIESDINDLRPQSGVSDDDARIVALETRYNNLDRMAPSDPFKSEYIDEDIDDLKMM